MTNISVSSSWKPELLYKLPQHTTHILDAICIPEHDTIITSAKDCVLRIFKLREDGKNYWPSSQEILPSCTICLLYSKCPPGNSKNAHLLYAGQENGTITEFALSDDTNALQRNRDILAHQDSVTGMVLVIQNEWLVSVSRDKSLAIYSINTATSMAGHRLDRPATSLACDAVAKYCFIGDSKGEITILRLDRNAEGLLDFVIINVLKGHSHAITHLAWDSVTSRLLSSSSDKLLIMWDIGGNQGTAFDLHGHSDSVTSVEWWVQGSSSIVRPTPQGDKQKKTQPAGGLARPRSASPKDTLVISAGLDMQLIIWLITANRKPTPVWQNSDTCQICGSAFFWNLAKSFNDFSIGKLQHHCRRCGKAICAGCSAPKSVRLPLVGYEQPVRVCTECSGEVTEEEQESMVLAVPTVAAITKMHLDEARNRLITVDESKNVRVWSLDQKNVNN